jgi:hypothetical protein
MPHYRTEQNASSTLGNEVNGLRGGVTLYGSSAQYSTALILVLVKPVVWLLLLSTRGTSLPSDTTDIQVTCDETPNMSIKHDDGDH